jgi:outer membrane murein-binding lipoprotein Lpp
MTFNWLSRLAASLAPDRGRTSMTDEHTALMLRMDIMSDTFTTKLDTLTSQVAALNQGITAIWTRVQAKDVKMSALLAQVQAAGDPAASAENVAKLEALSTAIQQILATLPTIAPETDPAPTIAEAPAAFAAPTTSGGVSST